MTHPGIKHGHRGTCRKRNSAHARNKRPIGGTYSLRMPPSLAARREGFSRFVKRAMEHVRVTKGWTVAQVLKETGIGRTTLYRWINGDWIEAPSASQIEAFCDGLGFPVSEAFEILWPGKHGRPKATPPPPMDPDLELLMRKLADPNVPDMEKFFIQETLRQLAARVATDQPRPRKRGA